MNIINFSSILQNFGENVNFRNFKTNCRVNAKICVFVSTYTYMISLLVHSFFSTIGKVTDSQKFNRTNHLISSNNHPLATANKEINISKEKEGLQNQHSWNII